MDKTPVEIIRALDNPFLGPPLGGSFRELDVVVASGYNATEPVEVSLMPYHVGTSSECPASKPHAVIKDSDGRVMGCHSSREDAQRQIAAIHANEGKSTMQPIDLAVAGPNVTGDGYETNFANMTGTPWEGVLAVEGVETGDGRKFAENAITWADPPLPLRRNIEDSHGGVPNTKTVLVGSIQEVYRDPERPTYIMGRGVFDDQGTNGAEALRLVRDKFLSGVSIDPDDIKDADIELIFPPMDDESAESESIEDLLFAPIVEPDVVLFHAGRIRAATLVDIPAFVEAKIWLTDSMATPASSGGTPGYESDHEHFTQLSDRVWNGPQHELKLGAKMNLRTARHAYAHVDAGSPTKISTRFLHHEVTEDGRVGLANLTACSASLRAINAGRAETLSETERRAAHDHLARHLAQAGITPPPYESSQFLTASGVEDRPPAEWFVNPQLDELTPFTVTDELTAGGWRRVYGHGAGWRACHTSFVDVCRTPPREGDHAYYRVGEAVCADGSRVAVGTVTLGTGHAPLRNITSSQAAEHYDNTGTVVAMVASGEDAHGIWIAGAMPPGVPASRVVSLQASALSGDWRRIGGKLRLVAFLAVNHPGFPIPRTQTFVSQLKQLGLVAAGVVTQEMRHVHRVDPRATLERIAKSIGRDRDTRMEALRARVKGA